MEDTKNQSLSWTAPEYTHRPKSVDFLWGVGLLGLIGTVISIFLGNYIFAIFIILSSVMLIIFATRHPHEANFEINNTGIVFGEENHPYKNIKGFIIRDANPYSKLIIETNKYFLPIYTIPLPHELEEDVYDILSQVIEEKEIEETHSSKFMERIGF